MNIIKHPWYKIKKSNMISYNVIGHNKTLPVFIDTLQSTVYTLNTYRIIC